VKRPVKWKPKQTVVIEEGIQSNRSKHVTLIHIVVSLGAGFLLVIVTVVLVVIKCLHVKGSTPRDVFERGEVVVLRAPERLNAMLARSGEAHSVFPVVDRYSSQSDRE
jgi:hypothetical protein